MNDTNIFNYVKPERATPIFTACNVCFYSIWNFFVITMYWALKVEKLKKKNVVACYKLVPKNVINYIDNIQKNLNLI